MRDSTVYYTTCCNFMFIGMNHSPEQGGVCRHCGGVFGYRAKGAE